MKFLLIAFLAFCVVYAKHEVYDGHVVFEIYVKDVDEVKLVNDLVNELMLDIWSYAVPGRPGQIFVSKTQKKPFKNALEAAGVKYELKMENIRKLLELEDQKLAASKRNRNRFRISFGGIYTFKEVCDYLADIAHDYPNVTKLVNGGTSIEGRPIEYLEISTSNFLNKNKPIVMIQSLLHAREWITLPVSLYAIHKLVVDVTESYLVNDIDWIILPVANPDGYIWSHTSERFWRKNRRSGLMIGNVCSGVDLNRNFDVNWGTASSNNICTETYHGTSPMSEPEAQAVGNILNRYKSRLALYSDIHSFGSLILFGWGNGTLPQNALLNLGAVRMAEAINSVKWASLPNYRVGNIAHMLNYQSSGGGSEYAQVIGIPYSYAYELPTYTGSGINGFLVSDPQFIEHISFETWVGIKAGARYVLSVFSN